MKRVLALSLVALLSGCATVAPSVPETYKGPVVSLADTGFQESGGKGVFFAAMALDGRSIENSIRASRMASNGRGFSLNSQYTTRNVPLGPVKVSLTGTHQTAAPIHEMAARMAGTFFSVDGVVDFKPVEGKSYIVTGELKKEQSCVWIEEAETKQLSTEKVCTK